MKLTQLPRATVKRDEKQKKKKKLYLYTRIERPSCSHTHTKAKWELALLSAAEIENELAAENLFYAIRFESKLNEKSKNDYSNSCTIADRQPTEWVLRIFMWKPTWTKRYTAQYPKTDVNEVESERNGNHQSFAFICVILPHGIFICAVTPYDGMHTHGRTRACAPKLGHICRSASDWSSIRYTI